MTDPAIETSKAIRHRSLRFIHQSKTTTDYELPSLRAKPRKRQASTSGSDNDSNTDNEDENDIELDELSDSSSEDHDFEQDSDDGSVFSMDEADELDNEEELASPTRKDRQRRRQHDTLADDNTKSSRPRSRSRKRQTDNDDDDSKTPELNDNHIEQATSNGQHHPKRRKLRPSHSIQSTVLYNGLLSDDSDLMDQDIGLQYPSDMDIVMNDRRGKSTTTSPLVLGSPSKVAKPQSDTGRKQQPSSDISPDRIAHSSPSTAHGLSPSSKLEKWPRRPQASAFLDKLQANTTDTLDLSQHSFIPDDFMEPHSTASTRGSSGIAKSDADDMDDSDSMAYQYDFSTISEPNPVAVNPTSSDATVEDQGDPHTHQLNTDPPTPTPTPNTTRDEQPQQSPGFFRRIVSFLFG